MINFTRNPKLYFIPALIVGMTVMFFGCEGPEGPAGSEGLQGLPGADANETCKVCHSDGDEPIKVRQLQWAASTHATGGNFERNDTDCAPCHTSQGFLEVVATGADTTVADISNPAPQNCRTCHQIHSTYTWADFALTDTTAFTPRIDLTASIDIGKGNLCARCHQPRLPDPMPTVGGSDVVIGSKYWGPHYGAQGAILAGVGGYEVTGSPYTNSSHTAAITDGCVTCHMADAYGIKAGGHTMNVSYDYYGTVVNQAGCLAACHPEGEDALETKIADRKAAIDALLADVKALLITADALDDTDHVVPGTLTALNAGAVVNYLLVLKDRSGGAHNFAYASALLTNTKVALEAAPAAPKRVAFR